MKYPALKRQQKEAEKTYTIAGFESGIDDNNGKFADDDAVLEDCQNMIFEDGYLKTRTGFRVKPGDIIKLEGYHDIVYLPFTVTETVYYINSAAYNLAYCCLGDDSEAILKVYLVSREGNISPAGEIYFHRVDSQLFNVPFNVFFTVANSIYGHGVFAYVSRAGRNTRAYNIYEATDNFTQWQSVSSSVYIPTVRIHGRGERYDRASSYTGLDYPEPERLEELNLLSGYYRCYFTSDGLSSIFRLPYGNIDVYSTLKCRLYSSSEEYIEWTIPDYEDRNTQVVDGKSVTLFLNRTLGTIRFYSSPEDYCVPVMPNCKANNIMVTACTLENIARDSIISSKGAVCVDNRLYFYGNENRKNCIYCSKMSNPLYIPESSKLYLGDATTPVVSLKVQNGKLIAFKSGETYRIITSFSDDVIEKETVLPESTIYVRGDTLSAQTIDNTIGCISEKTIRLCGSRLVWMGGDKSIYALATTTYGNTTNIYRISQPIDGRIKSIDFNIAKAFAITKGGKYILFLGSSVFAMNFKVRGFGFSKAYYAKDDTMKSPAWFAWHIPSDANFYNGAQTETNALIMSSFNREEAFYLTVPSGDCDSFMIRENDTDKEEEQAIESGIKTKIIDLGDAGRLKRIDSIFISGECSDKISLSVSDTENEYAYSVRLKQNGDFLRLASGIPYSGRAAIEIKSKSPLKIRSVLLKYKQLSDKG